MARLSARFSLLVVSTLIEVARTVLSRPPARIICPPSLISSGPVLNDPELYMIEPWFQTLVVDVHWYTAELLRNTLPIAPAAAWVPPTAMVLLSVSEPC